MMRYLSVCSGIEAATVAWHPLGWTPAAFSEIEAFPRAVLAHHYPEVPCHGDFTTIGADDYGPIDLLVGGTPCQSFSIAGLRGGLADDRGNLALEYLRLADRKRPRWLVWENVPGVLSSLTHDAPDPCEPPPPLDLECDGAEVETFDDYHSEEIHAFECFLAGLRELGYGFAYRVLDAQFFGVAQRRRRVFVVGYLGDWRRAAAVLFERHSLSGHPAPRREKGQSAPTIPSRSSAGGGLGTDFDCDGGLIAYGGNNTSGPIDVATALNAKSTQRQDFETETLIAFSAKDHGADATVDCSPTLRSGGHSKSHANAGVMPAIAFNLRGREDGAQPEADPDNLAAMRAASGGSSRSYVAFNARQDPGSGPVVEPLGAKDTGHGVLTSSAVRRLTPRECERLQGFPDDYTLVPYRGKQAADGPRYKALGNSMAVPVMRWIGERIAAVEAIADSERSAA